MNPIPNTAMLETKRSVKIKAEDGYTMLFTKLAGGRWELTEADEPTKPYHFDLRKQAHYLLNP